VPFVVGVTLDVSIKAVGLAVTYAENDLCIVRNDSGITKENATELEGRMIGSPIGNVTYYRLLRVLDHLGVDAGKIDLVQMDPGDVAVALILDDIVMGCAFDGPLDRMKTVGTPLMTGSEQEAVGIHAFDVITVTEKANQAYLADLDKFAPIIADASGMELDNAKAILANFSFLTAEQQVGSDWLGGGVQSQAGSVAQTMVQAGDIDGELDDYTGFFDAEYLK